MTRLSDEMRARLVSLALVGFVHTQTDEPAGGEGGDDAAVSGIGYARAGAGKAGMSKIGLNKAGLTKPGFSRLR